MFVGFWEENVPFWNIQDTEKVFFFFYFMISGRFSNSENSVVVTGGGGERADSHVGSWRLT